MLMFKFEFVFFVFGSGFVLRNRTGEAFITKNQAVQELTTISGGIGLARVLLERSRETR